MTNEEIARHIDAMRWRGKLKPLCVLSKTQPLAMTSTACRLTMLSLFEHREQWHSAQGGTLWAVLDFLQSSGTPYILEATPGEGYLVKLK